MKKIPSYILSYVFRSKWNITLNDLCLRCFYRTNVFLIKSLKYYICPAWEPLHVFSLSDYPFSEVCWALIMYIPRNFKNIITRTRSRDKLCVPFRMVDSGWNDFDLKKVENISEEICNFNSRKKHLPVNSLLFNQKLIKFIFCLRITVKAMSHELEW